MDTSVLEPYILCDICTLIMWHLVMSVYSMSAVENVVTEKYNSLPDCGHIYCEGCIQKWFDTIQHDHKVKYPDSIYDPDYICPMCHNPAFNRPVEVYTMKSLVQTVTTAQGEGSPRSGSRAHGSNANRVGGVDQWDRFFPPTSNE